VGSAQSEEYDQELDSVLVGPISVGSYKIVFQAPAPDPAKIPAEDLIGVTVIILSCLYRDAEFVRVGYYVANEYTDESLKDDPPEVPQVDKVERRVLADKPRVTRYPIEWDDPAAHEEENQPPQAMSPG